MSILNSHPFACDTRLAASHFALLTSQVFTSEMYVLVTLLFFSGCLHCFSGFISTSQVFIPSGVLISTRKSTKYLCGFLSTGLTYGITTSSEAHRMTFVFSSQNFMNFLSHILRYMILVGSPMYLEWFRGLKKPLYAIHKYVAAPTQDFNANTLKSISFDST